MKKIYQDEIEKYDFLYENTNYNTETMESPHNIVAFSYINSISNINKILDAGVGRGTFYNYLKNRYNTFGLEGSKNAIERYHKNDTKIKNILISDIPKHYSKEEFDVVNCLEVMEHIPPAETYENIEALCYVTKKYAVISVANLPDIIEGKNLHINLREFEEWDSIFSIWFNIIERITTQDNGNCIYLLEKKDSKYPELKYNAPEQPLISIIMPCYNHDYIIHTAIDSVLAQTYQNWELIIVNDGSTDSTPQIIQKYSEKDPRIKVFSKENGGISSASNYGLQKSNGEWICLIATDDLFEPGALETMYKATRSYPNHKFFHFDYSIIEGYGGFESKKSHNTDRLKYEPQIEFQTMNLLQCNYINAIAWLGSRKVFEEVGYYDETLNHAQDHDMWLRISSKFQIKYINELVSITREHPDTGTNRFVLGNDFGSARVALNFLNENTFDKLFPNVDLSKIEGINYAIQMAIRLGLNLDAFMYRGVGYVPALIDRLNEWISCNLPSQVIDWVYSNIIEKYLNEINKIVELPQTLKDAYNRLLNVREVKFVYQEYEPYTQFENNIKYLRSIGRDIEPYQKADEIELFINKIEKYRYRQRYPDEKLFLNKANAQADVNALISIITPTMGNRNEMLGEAIESVLAQTYQNWEMLIVNDGGPDISDFVNSFNEPRIKYIHKQKNEGLPAARNTALENADGEYVILLDDDDIYLPNHLETLYTVAKETGYKLVYTNTMNVHMARIDDKYYPIYKIPFNSREYSRKELLINCILPVMCLLIKKECFDIAGNFDNSLKACEDWEMWMRFARYFDFLYVKKITAEYRIRMFEKNQITSNKRRVLFYTKRLNEMYIDDAKEYPGLIERQKKSIDEAENNISREERYAENLDKNFIRNQESEAAPVVSILIPSVDPFDLNLLCIDLIYGHDVDEKFEIIVVNNDLEEDRINLLKVYEHRKLIKFIHNTEPQTYAHSINQAASIAQGEYLLLLDNDARVQQNTINSLVRKFREDKNIGLQGMLKVTMGQKIEACGAEIKKDSLGNQYIDYILNNRSNNDPEVFQGREMPMVTGAAYAIPKSLFEEVGGLDEKFLYGFESFDLSMKVREAGYKVFYNPDSVVFHLGEFAKRAMGIDSSTQRGQAMIEYNRNYFLNKWKDTKEHKGNSLTPEPISWLNVADNNDNNDNNKYPVALVEKSFLVCFNYQLYIELLLQSGNNSFVYKGNLPTNHAFQSFVVKDGNNRDYLVDNRTFFESFFRNYNYNQALENKKYCNNYKPTIAFTVHSPTIRNGGVLMVFRYANLLSSLGFDVTVYGDQELTVNHGLNTKYVYRNGFDYSPMNEDVVILYSLFEIGLYINSNYEKADFNAKRIILFSQCLEEYLYGDPEKNEMIASKDIFQLLNSVPIAKLAISKHLQQYYLNEYKQESYLIENYCDQGIFNPNKRKKSDKWTVLAIGNPFHYLKGIKNIAEAILDLQKLGHNDIHLKIISNVKDEKAIHNKENWAYRELLDQNKLHILYQLNAEEVANELGSSQVFINSSYYEGFGLTSIEAMSVGVPLIQANNYGMDEVAIDDYNCFRYDPNDKKKLVELILKIKNNKQTCETITSNAFETAKNYSEEIWLSNFKKTFSQITDVDLLELPQKTDLVSIITPTMGNRNEVLRKAINSVIAQSYQNWEMLVVNDGGPDISDFINSFKEPRIKYIHKKTNEGASASRNSAIHKSNGKFIALLDDDDLFYPNHLSSIINALKASGKKIGYSSVRTSEQINMNGQFQTIHQDMDSIEEFSRQNLLAYNYIKTPSIIIHRDCFDSCGIFDEKLILVEDWDMWIRLSQKYDFIHVNEVTAEYFIRLGDPEQMTANKAKELHYMELIYKKFAHLTNNNPEILRMQDAYRNIIDAQRITNERVPQNIERNNKDFGKVKLSILVPEANSYHYCKTLINRIYTYPPQGKFEIIVVIDEKTTDGTNELMRYYKDRNMLQIVEVNTNKSLNEAVNLAKEMSKGEQFVIIDKNTMPDANFFQNKSFQNSKNFTKNYSTANSSTANKLRVLTTMYGWNESGGGTMFPKSVCKELAKNNIDISVFYATHHHPESKQAYYLERKSDDGVNLFGVYNRPTVFLDPDNPLREVNDPEVVRLFSQVLDEVKPDIVHFQNFLGLSFALAKETKRRGIPTLYTPHNYHLIDPALYMINSDMKTWESVDLITQSEYVKNNPDKKSQYQQRKDAAINLLNNEIDYTLAVSTRVQQLLSALSGNINGNIKVLNQINPITQKLHNEIHKTNNEVHSPIRFGFIGSVLPHKGIHNIVKAAQEINKNDAQFFIYGSGNDDYINIMKRLDTKGNVQWMGEYKQDQLPNIANNLDVAIVPSIWEDCAPLVIAENLAMKLPVLGADIGGIRDFVRDRYNGALYSYNSVDELVILIKELIDKPQLIAEWRKNISLNISFESFVKHTIGIYHLLHKNKRLSDSEIQLHYLDNIIENKNMNIFSNKKKSLRAELGNIQQTNTVNIPKEDNHVAVAPVQVEDNTFSADTSLPAENTPMNRIKLEQDLSGGFANQDAQGVLPKELPSPLRLNLGCGRDVREGFLNLDLFSTDERVIKMDIRKLGFPDNSVDLILASDVLEHFSHRETDSLLKEWGRVLKKGGILIIRCPSLRLQAKAYISGAWDADIASYMIFGGQTNPGDYHCIAFDEASIRKHLTQSGFKVLEFDEQDTPQNRGYINLNMEVISEKV